LSASCAKTAEENKSTPIPQIWRVSTLIFIKAAPLKR
jgi:hypothetical protein